MSDFEGNGYPNKSSRKFPQGDFRRQANANKNSVSKRKQKEDTCANPNCGNPKQFRRKFQNKNNFYCPDCTKIIDRHEYCHICFEISALQEKNWVACDSCNEWVHIECEETKGSGMKLSGKDMSKVSYECLKCKNQTMGGVNSKANRRSSALDTRYSGNYNEGSGGFMPLVKDDKGANGHPSTSTGGPGLDSEALLKARKKEIVPADFSWQYFYSENYQSVEKLMGSLGHNLFLTEEEYNNDFMTIYKEVDDKEKLQETLKNCETMDRALEKIATHDQKGLRKPRLNNELRNYNKKF